MGILDRIIDALGGPQEETEADRLIDEIIAIGQIWWEVELKDLEAGRRLLERSREEQRDVAVDLIGFLRSHRDGLEYGHAKFDRCKSACACLKALLKRHLPFTDSDLLALVDWQNRMKELSSGWLPLAGTAKALSHFAKTRQPSKELDAATEQLGRKLLACSWDADCRKYGRKITDAIGVRPELPIVTEDVWAEQAMADLVELPGDQVEAWTDLLAHCQTASAGKPSGKWLNRARTFIPESIPEEQFRDFVIRWFPLVDKPRAEDPRSRVGRVFHAWSPHRLVESNQDILKGLAWCCSLLNDPALTRALSALCISAFRKVPDVGVRATRLGNACIYTLGAIEGQDSLAQLARLKVKIKNRGAQNQIAKALQAAADREGVTPDEIEEMSVPEYGLTGIGVHEKPVGELTARLSVDGSSGTELIWIRPDGKTQKSVPAAVRENFADELEDLRADARDIRKMLPVIRERIDSSYLDQRSWTYGTWRRRYFDHPLVGSLARRLIWIFGEGEGARAVIWNQDGWVDHHGNTVEVPVDGDGETVVRLWHPLDSETGKVLAWRSWLEEHLVRQPFKQAHREIYMLTEAEETTGTYSNRYAAHIIRQHQFNALCLARGWKNRLRLMVDDVYPPPSRFLEPWGIRAEFWIEGIGDNYDVDTTGTGTFLYLATDQVRFYPIDAAQYTAHAGGGGYGPGWGGDAGVAMPLAGVPKLVFSEIMRDIDLFVGVASVGNDPEWSDGGPGGHHRDYWQSYSFGDLSATARTRKEILERLLPRLKIADRARIDGRFLVVGGKLRTYKIHLGSGNVLMSPDDRYLCIVPNAAQRRRGTDKLFLPFEGDNTMAIILSKAFLLGDDDKIKDRTILGQIGGR